MQPLVSSLSVGDCLVCQAGDQPRLYYDALSNNNQVAESQFCQTPQRASVVDLTFVMLNSVALVRERTIPTERPPPVGEVSANFCG